MRERAKAEANFRLAFPSVTHDEYMSMTPRQISWYIDAYNDFHKE